MLIVVLCYIQGTLIFVWKNSNSMKLVRSELGPNYKYKKFRNFFTRDKVCLVFSKDLLQTQPIQEMEMIVHLL